MNQTTYTLNMVFKCENGEKASVSLTDVKASLTSGQIQTAMDAMINSNAFGHPLNGKFVAKISAKVVVADTTPYEFA